ncbi:N6-L-threonylcarbamoyladenine synthase [Flexibacter flexilis DSM 6793]|uniref:tRNA N6-adenosine threonylcarbamoyltransferase n=1 Tax=Flexibacter flexilis DSM 6793 TaxID=927664 RepID=A0A1I1K367_9BACT|nr:tRNA (adenosine(37)-N6)-threonylcarbamoyltransferase complex transferase subunit TsaD [Flexibacter flexilis]SFC52443.1 N6-L-threonylcarbamoyladenine synthase [Flexibacter flexilis DSM 6793]
MPIILAIESSCDETSAAVIADGQLLSNITATQAVHTQYGGVVPELASRAHQQNVVPVVAEALRVAGISKQQLSAVAFTQGPGLLGALLVGSSFAKSLALGLNIPLLGVNHIQAHILSHFIEEPRPKFPFLCLTVSGGHTQIVQVNAPSDIKILGETQDDAVGEAFDKTAKLIGLPYPGGPLIDRYAKDGNPKAFAFPVVEMQHLDFSFSGIKTAFMYFLKDKSAEFIAENRNDICASVQYTLVEILMRKLRKAVRETGITEVAIAGGVSANSGLRNALTAEAEKRHWNIYVPRFEYCTDNAAMIAMTAHFLYQENKTVGQNASPMPRMTL